MSSPISSVRLTLEGASAAKPSCCGIGILALCLGFLWQCTTVYRNYGGDWTALFCIGSVTAVPPELHGGYRFQQSTGFDGQFYYIIALDPLFRRGLDHYVDWPGLRYRRILVPALAYAGALGQPN